MALFPCPRERIAASALLLLSKQPPKFRLAEDDDYESPREEGELISKQPPKFCLDEDDDYESPREERELISSESFRSRKSLISKQPPNVCLDESESFRELSLVSSDSKSCEESSLLTSARDVSAEEIRARKIRLMALAALRREMNLTVVRRSRSKTIQRTFVNSWKTSTSKAATTTSFGSESTTTESSCLSSSNSSVISSARSHRRDVSRAQSKLAVVREEPKRKRHVSAHMRHKAEAILELLSGGCCYSEVKIRRTLGDSPDTSKALRLLLKLEEVKRSGKGGRRNPFIYTIA